MANNEIIGSIDLKERTFTFGRSDEDAPCYKNNQAFNQSSDQICYIPENGAGTEVLMCIYSLDDSTTYTYADFEKLIADFLGEHYIYEANNVRKVLEWEQRLFDACQWQDPSTIIDEWERSIDDEVEGELKHKCMISYISKFDWTKNTKLLEKVYEMLPSQQASASAFEDVLKADEVGRQNDKT